MMAAVALLPVATEKRQRQDLGRMARLEVVQQEQALKKRKAQTRKYGIAGAVIVAIIGLLLFLNRNGDSTSNVDVSASTTVVGPSTSLSGASTTSVSGASTTSVVGASTTVPSASTTVPNASTTAPAPVATIAPAALSSTKDLTKKPVVVISGQLPPPLLGVTEIVTGSGPEAKAGDKLSMQYVGVAWSTKAEFDASWGRGQPFEFVLGAGDVIKGWDQGLLGMKVGGRRQLVIPSELGYGARGTSGIAANETLVFVVDLLSVNGQKR